MKRTRQSTVRRYFAGLVENVFQTELGVADPSLHDYMSGLLCRFIRTDSIFGMRSVAGKRITEVADMLIEAGERIGTAGMEAHRHIGDFTLFWAGLYPEALQKMQHPDNKDHFIDYCNQGKRSYFIAGGIQLHEGGVDPSSETLDKLSHDFEMCAYGLREVRRVWEEDGKQDFPKPIIL